MGLGGDGNFAERERRAATRFTQMASEDGVARVIYLGGLGDNPSSQHLKSRQETAQMLENLAQANPPSTPPRAARSDQVCSVRGENQGGCCPTV